MNALIGVMNAANPNGFCASAKRCAFVTQIGGFMTVTVPTGTDPCSFASEASARKSFEIKMITDD